MAYVEQIFTSGQVLKAEHLNYMERGIVALENDIENIRKEIDSGGISYPDPVSLVEGYYISNYDRKNAELASYNIAKYRVHPGDKVNVTCKIGSGSGIYWVDSAGVRSLALTGDNNDGININTTLVAPATAMYVEVSYSTTQPMTFSIGDMSIEDSTEESQFTNMKIGILGDSIAAAGGFFNTLKSILGASSGTNVAVGGWVYSEDTSNGDFPNDSVQGIYRQVANLTGDEKLIILWAGTNDFGHSHKLGKPFVADKEIISPEPDELTTGYYINKDSLKNTELGSYNIAKYKVNHKEKVTVTCYMGGASCITWTDSYGIRSLVMTGNSNTGININTTLLVPDNAEYIEIAYSTTQPMTFSIEVDGVRNPSTDVKTFYGGLHRVIQDLYSKFGYIPIVLCTPLQRVFSSDISGYPESSRDCNKVGNRLDDYAEAIRTVANYYSIPVFDSCAMTNLDPNNEYINANYFSDGLHPNSEGHTIIGNALAKFINNHLYVPIK